MRRSTFILAVIMGWVLVSGAFFQSSAKGKPEGGFPVTVTFGYSDPREDGDAIQSDDPSDPPSARLYGALGSLAAPHRSEASWDRSGSVGSLGCRRNMTALRGPS